MYLLNKQKIWGHFQRIETMLKLHGFGVKSDSKAWPHTPEHPKMP